jgi:hypothetical protein
MNTAAIPEHLPLSPVVRRAGANAFPDALLPTFRRDASAMPSLAVPNRRVIANLAGCAVSSKLACLRLKNYSWSAKMRQVGHGRR